MPVRTRLLNIGAELKRLAHWLELDDRETAKQCIARTCELLDVSIEVARSNAQRRELGRAREVVQELLNSPDPRTEIALLIRTLVGEV